MVKKSRNDRYKRTFDVNNTEGDDGFVYAGIDVPADELVEGDNANVSSTGNEVKLSMWVRLLIFPVVPLLVVGLGSM